MELESRSVKSFQGCSSDDKIIFRLYWAQRRVSRSFANWSIQERSVLPSYHPRSANIVSSTYLDFVQVKDCGWVSSSSFVEVKSEYVNQGIQSEKNVWLLLTLLAVQLFRLSLWGMKSLTASSRSFIVLSPWTERSFWEFLPWISSESSRWELLSESSICQLLEATGLGGSHWCLVAWWVRWRSEIVSDVCPVFYFFWIQMPSESYLVSTKKLIHDSKTPTIQRSKSRS